MGRKKEMEWEQRGTIFSRDVIVVYDLGKKVLLKLVERKRILRVIRLFHSYMKCTLGTTSLM